MDSTYEGCTLTGCEKEDCPYPLVLTRPFLYFSVTCQDFARWIAEEKRECFDDLSLSEMIERDDGLFKNNIMNTTTIIRDPTHKDYSLLLDKLF